MKQKFSTIYGVNPKIPHPNKRPRCLHRNCNNSVQIVSAKTDGSPRYRSSGLCGTHHGMELAKRHGVKNKVEITAKRRGMTVTEYTKTIQANSAKKQGFKNYNELLNAKHPYRKHRKDYCENKDGRLGYNCRVKIRISAQLEVDHKNGNPKDNRPQNLQTLCCMCHKYKTYTKADYATPGRKSLGVSRR